MRKRSVPLVVLVTLLTAGLLAAAAGVAVVFGGLYDVAATTQHFQPVFSITERALRASVRLRARDIAEPPPADERMLLRGAACFRDLCVQCHGAPGVAQEAFGQAMQPLPGPLVDARRHWRPRELYWITKHGIRLTGMPAWEMRLDEEELWSVVAFMQKLPDLGPAGYADWMRRAPALSCTAPSAVAQDPGDVERGLRALHQHACTACHQIPGTIGSQVHVGPPLKDMASRKLIAGTLANTPDNMVRWLRETQQVKPGTAMPQLGVSEQAARDMAAYLATLK